MTSRTSDCDRVSTDSSVADLSNRRHPILDRIVLPLATAHSRRMLARLLEATTDTAKSQNDTLLSKIHRNQKTEYGRDYGFNNIRRYEDFVRQIPITKYETLEPYIEKVKAGNIEAMFGSGQKVFMFAKTSGTTNTPKYIPVTTPFLQEYRQGWNAFGIRVLMDHPDAFLRPIVQMTSAMDEEYSSGGFPCGAITGLMAATQKRLVRRYYVVPRDIGYIEDATARYYCAMRFCITTNAAFMITASPATQLRLVRTADRFARQLIQDVRDGTICRDIDIPTDLRRHFEGRLKPDTASAKRLNAIAERTGRLLPKDYWKLSFLANWTGGTMGLHLRDFPEYFGDTPVRDIGLLASEGRMSTPIEDHTSSGILDLCSNFYEFIPAEEYESEKPTVLRAHELEKNREYFILLTTSAGFYRYDIGDRVRVTDFHQTTPKIEFLHKGLHTCSITGEKLTEQQVVMAFDEAAGKFNLNAHNFVLAPQWSECPFYRLHLEPTDTLDAQLAQNLSKEFERRMQAINIEYASKRESGRLAAIQLNLLPNQWLTNHDLKRAACQRRGNEQFKHRFLLSQIGDDREFPVAHQ